MKVTQLEVERRRSGLSPTDVFIWAQHFEMEATSYHMALTLLRMERGSCRAKRRWAEFLGARVRYQAHLAFKRLTR